MPQESMLNHRLLLDSSKLHFIIRLADEDQI
jgi:hypothetical protein